MACFHLEIYGWQHIKMNEIWNHLSLKDHEQVPAYPNMIVTLNQNALNDRQSRHTPKHTELTGIKAERGYVRRLNQTRSPLEITGAGRG